MDTRRIVVYTCWLAGWALWTPTAVAQSAETDSIVARALTLLELNCATCMGADSADMIRGYTMLEEVWVAGAVRDTATVVDAMQGVLLNLAYAYDRGRETHWLGRRHALAATWVRARPDDPEAIMLYLNTLPVDAPERDSLVLAVLALDSLQPFANLSYGWRLMREGQRERAEIHLIRSVCHLSADNRYRAGVTRDLRNEFSFELRCPDQE